MESEKPGFSEDGDHHSDPENITETVDPSSKRSYECVFCKRGFTNAQALGGHMNIHRKDRPKSSSSSKQVLNPTVSNPNPYPCPAALIRVTRPFPFEESDIPDSWEALRRRLPLSLAHADATKYLNNNYPLMVPSSSSNFGRTVRFEDKLESDLNLRIGSSSFPKNNEEVAANSDEERLDIDLELRLGRGDP